MSSDYQPICTETIAWVRQAGSIARERFGSVAVWTKQDRSPVTEAGPVVHSMHHGWADTPGVTDSIPGFAKVMGPILRTDTDGADTIVWLCAPDEAARSTGLFWHDRAPRPTHYPSWRTDDPAARDALWHRIVEATAIDPTTLGRG